MLHLENKQIPTITTRPISRTHAEYHEYKIDRFRNGTNKQRALTQHQLQK